MKSITTGNVIGISFSAHPVDLLKFEATINAGGDAVLYVQLHDTDLTPGDGAVPIKVWPASGGAELYKEFKQAELHLTKGLYAVVSTTSANLTTGTGNNKFEIVAVELDKAEEPTGTSVAGDLTTDVASLEVWAEANGPKKLIRLQVDAFGASADPSYIMLFAHDSPVDTDVPIEQWEIAAGDVFTALDSLFFGVNGRDVRSVIDAVLHEGCTVVMSSTPGVLTTAAAEYKIKAEYK